MYSYYAQWDDLSEYDISDREEDIWIDIEEEIEDLFIGCSACSNSGCSSCLE